MIPKRSGERLCPVVWGCEWAQTGQWGSFIDGWDVSLSTMAEGGQGGDREETCPWRRLLVTGSGGRGWRGEGI